MSFHIFIIFCSAIELREFIEELLKIEKDQFEGPKVKKEDQIKFPENFWEDLADFVKVLKPFKQMTVVLSQQKTSTAGQIIPMLLFNYEKKY